MAAAMMIGEQSHPLAVATAVCGGLGLAACSWMWSRYKVSAPHQYLVRTGLGIPDLKLSKTGIQWPLQQTRFINLTPTIYMFSLDAMSAEKLQFHMPGVMTIGPALDLAALEKYAKLVLNSDQESLVRGIIEGETRVLAASMEMDHLFQNRSEFKNKITQGVNEELQQFGLMVYNSNLQELQDSEGSEYFKYLRKKTCEGANNQAKIDVAEAQMKGDIGLRERESLTRQRRAEADARAIIVEKEREQEVARASADLVQKQIEYDRLNQLTKLEAEQAVELRGFELQRVVQQSRQTQELEKQRAELFTAATVEAEVRIKEAEGRAVATKCNADADLYAIQKHADAEFYKQQKLAEATRIALEAEAVGTQSLVQAFGGRPETLLHYRMLDRGVLEKLAEQNAKAVQNLNPKITVWNTTSDPSGQAANPFSSIKDLFQLLPPVLTTVQEQTGIQPPSWMVGMAPLKSDKEHLAQ
jgi:flotillin